MYRPQKMAAQTLGVLSMPETCSSASWPSPCGPGVSHPFPSSASSWHGDAGHPSHPSSSPALPLGFVFLRGRRGRTQARGGPSAISCAWSQGLLRQLAVGIKGINPGPPVFQPPKALPDFFERQSWLLWQDPAPSQKGGAALHRWEVQHGTMLSLGMGRSGPTLILRLAPIPQLRDVLGSRFGVLRIVANPRLVLL